MKIISTSFPGVLLIEPQVFGDQRGFFLETFNQRSFTQLTQLTPTFVQDNHSRSQQFVLRGLHYQLQHPQGKLLRVVVGEIFDVIVDLRQSSVTFGQWLGVNLSATNFKQLWIPPGFAHGFLVLSEVAEVLYKTTDYHHKEDEYCLIWNDLKVNVAWPILDETQLMISPKDKAGKAFEEIPYFP